MPTYRLPWPLSLQWPLRRSIVGVASFSDPAVTAGAHVAARPTESTAAPAAGAEATGAPCFAGLRITRAVQPSRSLAARVPAVIRRSPCRLPDGEPAPSQSATLRRDPLDPQRVRISGRLSEVCATLDRLVARHESGVAV